tara:strand:+ start:2252 stop:2431 length:180 start_codon:yes stop_codon:yes gene_type:complete
VVVSRCAVANIIIIIIIIIIGGVLLRVEETFPHICPRENNPTQTTATVFFKRDESDVSE